MERDVPLIWFYGIAVGVYAAIYPVYLRAEELEQQQFRSWQLGRGPVGGVDVGGLA